MAPPCSIPVSSPNSLGQAARLRYDSAAMNIQMFGTKKCPETRKAERWFKERGITFHAVDLASKGLAPGELRNVAARVGGMEALLDKGGRRYIDKGLAHSSPTAARIESLLLEDPLLCKTPIVRNGSQATVGYQPDVWATWS